MLLIINKSLTIAAIKRIDMYSPRKISKKETDLYSVLNPLTNSDSPSEKSKGERLVSASAVKKNRSIFMVRKGIRTDSFISLITKAK